MLLGVVTRSQAAVEERHQDHGDHQPQNQILREVVQFPIFSVIL
jgi:hypothetical protein